MVHSCFAVLDAIGKPGSGILDGQATMFGNYRQCVGVRAPDDPDDYDDEDEDEDAAIEKGSKFKEFFRGKYCMIHLKPWLPEKPPFYGFSTRIESLDKKRSEDAKTVTI